MDSNVLGPHWLGTADGADRNRICASGTLARRRFLTRSTESKSDRRRGSRPNKNKRSGALALSPGAIPPVRRALASPIAPIALLGREDLPTDGVRDYCLQLSRAFARRGEHLDVAEVRRETQGWLRAVGQLWRESRAWKGRWVLLQYTSLMWSRRGFPVGALAVLGILLTPA